MKNIKIKVSIVTAIVILPYVLVQNNVRMILILNFNIG